MAKFSGNVGFSRTAETAPGVYRPTSIEERPYFGDVLRDNYRLSKTESTNPDLTVSTQISIFADSYMLNNLAYMKYVSYIGILWNIVSFQVAYPRIIIDLGGVYNGPVPSIESDGNSTN